MKFLVEKLIVRRAPGSTAKESEVKVTNISRVHQLLIDRGNTGSSMGHMMQTLNLDYHQVYNAIIGLREKGVQVTYRKGMYRL